MIVCSAFKGKDKEGDHMTNKFYDNNHKFINLLLIALACNIEKE